VEELNRELADILEVDSVSDDELLEENDMWDSLARLSLLSFIDKQYSINLFQPDIENIKTVVDIKKVIKSKQ
jgi:acyl carrier protein